jgi:hypothetical protein
MGVRPKPVGLRRASEGGRVPLQLAGRGSGFSITALKAGRG